MILPIILLLIIVLLTSLTNEKFIDYYKMDSIDLKIDYYVIHMSSNLERRKNIQNMANKINKNIKIFEAIKGTDLLNSSDKNIDLLKIQNYDENIIFQFKYEFINEVGCYLSHLILIQSLLNTSYKYTLIFEDDFNILDNNFNDKLNDILDKIDDNFDILYLGNLNDNHGKNFKDDIFYIDTNYYLTGTHAYIINNKNIDKIYRNLLTINYAIDNKYKDLINQNVLNAYIIYPVIVGLTNVNSTIR
jgi:GR25 family glycosyltransferase involved in LPS biosynthesis